MDKQPYVDPEAMECDWIGCGREQCAEFCTPNKPEKNG